MTDQIKSDTIQSVFALDSTSIRSARQLVHLIEDAIATGQCQPGERLPAVRELASLADLSPVTVSAAIRDLRQRGLLVTEGRRGTFVSMARAHPPSRLTIDRPAESVDLSSGHPDYTLLPALHDTPVSLPARPDSATRLAELEELFRQGFAADDVTAEHIVFTHGAMEAVGGLLRSALSQGDAVAVEDPGYPHAHLLVDLLGMRKTPIALDDEGISPESLRQAIRAGAKAVIITARSQNPTGVGTTPQRHAELHAIISEHPDLLVIEDDYLAYLTSAPLRTLTGITTRWACIRSLSKSHGPDLRFAALSADPVTADRLDRTLLITSGWIPRTMQELVLSLMTGQHTLHALRNAARTYDRRRHIFLQTLRRHGIPVTGTNTTGLHVWIPTDDEARLCTDLLAKHWSVAPGSLFRINSEPAIRVTTTCLLSDQAEALAADLAAIRAHSAMDIGCKAP